MICVADVSVIFLMNFCMLLPATVCVCVCVCVCGGGGGGGGGVSDWVGGVILINK